MPLYTTAGRKYPVVGPATNILTKRRTQPPPQYHTTPTLSKRLLLKIASGILCACGLDFRKFTTQNKTKEHTAVIWPYPSKAQNLFMHKIFTAVASTTLSVYPHSFVQLDTDISQFGNSCPSLCSSSAPIAEQVTSGEAQQRQKRGETCSV